MLRKAPSARSSVPMLSVLAPAMVLGLAFASLDPGADLEQGFDAAARAEVIVAADLPAAPVGGPRALAASSIEEGSEAFWLTRAPDSTGVARVTWTAPVAPGDRIVANFGAFDRQILEVVTVEDASSVETSTRIETGAGAEPRFLLTCRMASGPAGALVRLVVDAAGRGITAAGTADRSL